MASPCDLLVLDLDGTLLRSDGTVSPRNAAACRNAEEAGIRVVVATGRSWIESRRALTPLEYRRPMVAAGGAVLSDGASGRTLVRRAMPALLVQEVVEALVGHGHAALLLKDNPPELDSYVVVGEADLDPASEWWFRAHELRFTRVPSWQEDPHPEHTVRIGVVAPGSSLTRIAAELRDAVRDRAMLQHWAAVTETEATGSQTHLLEIFNPCVDKWTMIEELCRREQIDPRRTVTVGDGLNDVPMLRSAGLGIAMGNAGPEARQAAGAVVAHHDADGVAEAVEGLLEGRWTLAS